MVNWSVERWSPQPDGLSHKNAYFEENAMTEGGFASIFLIERN